MKENEFIALISQHSGIINKISFLYVDDPTDREDLKQEIILQAWKSIGRFQGLSTFSTWLYRVALNTALTFQKKTNRQSIETQVPDFEFHDQKESNPKSEWLFRAIKTLNDVDKTIVALHLEQYNNEEIASILGTSKNNIAVKLYRIKEQLSNLLKSNENE